MIDGELGAGAGVGYASVGGVPGGAGVGGGEVVGCVGEAEGCVWGASAVERVAGCKSLGDDWCGESCEEGEREKERHCCDLIGLCFGASTDAVYAVRLWVYGYLI